MQSGGGASVREGVVRLFGRTFVRFVRGWTGPVAVQ
jgi:hypothetical protein